MEQDEFSLQSAPLPGSWQWFLMWGIIACMVFLADGLLYRAAGYAGPAVFFPVAAILLCAGSQRTRCSVRLGILSALLLTLCARMLWSGNVNQLLIAIWLLGAIVLAAQGMPSWLSDVIAFLARAVPAGYRFFGRALADWRQLAPSVKARTGEPQLLSILLPMISAAVFGGIFLLANPDLIDSVSSFVLRQLDAFWQLLERVSWTALAFWVCTAWLTAGLLQPATSTGINRHAAPIHESAAAAEHHLFVPFRNMLVTLIVVFAMYLVFEFRTLWFRSFEPGFHYSGYAHAGAFWLTLALALTTLTLPWIFRGPLLADRRVPILKRYAWVWSGLNLLLAVAVYNRLLIYVDFNGMTRMRVVGFLGVTAVIAGLLLVLRKIVQQQDFLWLLRRQLCAPAIAVFLYVLLPVDLLVHGYNVRRILAGSPEPCVQISEHPISADALPVLLPLLDCSDPIIREGVRGLLQLRRRELRGSDPASTHWTAIQLGPLSARRQLESAAAQLDAAGDERAAMSARYTLHDYAMQWW